MKFDDELGSHIVFTVEQREELANVVAHANNFIMRIAVAGDEAIAAVRLMELLHKYHNLLKLPEQPKKGKKRKNG